MEPGDPFRQGVQARQFTPQKLVVLLNNVTGQFVQGQLGWVAAGTALLGHFQFFNDGRRRDVFHCASLGQGPVGLRARVDLEALENAGTPRPLGDERTNRPLQERGY